MLKNTGLSSFWARSKASSDQGYQSTGLLACCCKYGLLWPARWLAIRLYPPAVPKYLDFLSDYGSFGHTVVENPFLISQNSKIAKIIEQFVITQQIIRVAGVSETRLINRKGL